MQTVEKETAASRPLTQLLIIGVGILILLFVVIGTIGDATGAATTSIVVPEGTSFALLALLAFIGGVLSFLSPCTLPILPAYFAFATQSGRQQIASNTIVFMLGVATMFSAFGAGASAVGSLLYSNQRLILLFGGGAVLAFGAMSLLGRGFTGLIQEEENPSERRGLWGAFVFGLTFSAGWTSCIGPILGIMMSIAATTGSILRGAFLLIIYTLGLGLPLIFVSTFIGRLSRQHVIWRVLRGKGWPITVPNWVLAAVWGLVAWRIGLALVSYSFEEMSMFAGQAVTAVHIYGLLAIGMAGAFLWVGTGPKGLRTQAELFLHSTQLISGVLFIALGILMLNSELARITAQLAGESSWLYDAEEWVFDLFLR
ncbi:MAG: cytochrome c biogenesis CcdA family protein [Chloroflexi bacterium]|nr:cytochrome c biogenesis CcdA family protein [Chloroflexota bacterium]